MMTRATNAARFTSTDVKARTRPCVFAVVAGVSKFS